MPKRRCEEKVEDMPSSKKPRRDSTTPERGLTEAEREEPSLSITSLKSTASSPASVEQEQLRLRHHELHRQMKHRRKVRSNPFMPGHRREERLPKPTHPNFLTATVGPTSQTMHTELWSKLVPEMAIRELMKLYGAEGMETSDSQSLNDTDQTLAIAIAAHISVLKLLPWESLAVKTATAVFVAAQAEGKRCNIKSLSDDYGIPFGELKHAYSILYTHRAMLAGLIEAYKGAGIRTLQPLTECTSLQQSSMIQQEKKLTLMSTMQLGFPKPYIRQVVNGEVMYWEKGKGSTVPTVLEQLEQSREDRMKARLEWWTRGRPNDTVCADA